MKHFKSLLSVVVFALALTFTSCMNGGNENSWDWAGFVTVGSTYGTPVLQVDMSNDVIYPTNPDVLKTKDGSYITKALVYIKYVTDSGTGTAKSTNVKGTIVAFEYPALAQKQNDQADTLKHDYPIAQIGNVWYSHGYLSALCQLKYVTNPELNMYPVKVGNDTLYVKLQYVNGGGENASSIGQGVFCYSMPSMHDPAFSDIMEGIQQKNDSIVVTVMAKSDYEKDLKVSVKAPYISIR